MEASLEFLKGLHAGEQILCIGNGPSLKNIPPTFLEARTNIVCNYFPVYMPWLRADYCILLDHWTADVLDMLDENTVALVPEQQVKRMNNEGYALNGTLRFEFMDTIPTVPRHNQHGLSFGSSLIAAAYLAFWMGATEALVVGFDCTKGTDRPKQTFGKSGDPHFYDDEHEAAYHRGWDNQFGMVRRFTKERGCEIVNLSDPTLSENLPRADWRDYA